MSQTTPEQDHVIELGSDFANSLGFTSDKFAGYLWRKGDTIIISLIDSLSPGQGNFSRLVKTIEEKGYRVEVPTPLGQMQQILVHWGYQKFIESHPVMGAVEVWRKAESVSSSWRLTIGAHDGTAANRDAAVRTTKMDSTPLTQIQDRLGPLEELSNA